MDDWIKFGLISAIIVAAADILRKTIVKKVDPYVTVMIPLSIAGLIAFIVLVTNGFKKEIKTINKKEFCMLVFLGILMPLGQYIITRSLQDSSNPGYAKTIVSLNVLISTFVYAYFFKESSVNIYTIGGILLVLGGTYLITNKA
jgi:uncharacterized membrane protein